MKILLFFFFLVSSVVQVSAQTAGDILLPADFELVKNDQEDFLFTYISYLHQEPMEIIGSWEQMDTMQQSTFMTKNASQFQELLQIYLSNGDLLKWFLSYLDWVEEFENNLLAPVILLNGETLFQLPKLHRTIYTYMPIRTITNVTSYQWRLKPHLITDELGFTRYGKAYAIALGSYFNADIGNIYKITFANGEIITGILADVKSDLHTDVTNRYRDDREIYDGEVGNIVEFVMDDSSPNIQAFPSTSRANSINFLIKERFPTEVIEIRLIGRADYLK